MSKAFTYVKNQFLLGGFNEPDLATLVSRSVITESERIQIIALKEGN